MGSHSLPEPGKGISQRAALAVAAGAGSELLAWVGVAIYVGHKADARFGTEPWLLLVSTLLGISFGLYRFVRQASVRPKDPSQRP